jgi:hypothetical protein
VNGWVLAELAAAALAVSVVVAAAAGRWLRGRREGREAAGEHPVSHPARLDPPAGYAARSWLIVGARVVHDEHGIGTVVTSVVGLGHVGVTFDDGPGRWVPATSIDPITPDDELLWRAMAARRPTLPNTREDQP